MNIDKDYYETLGVLPTADDIVIRAVYRVLAGRYHPDRNRSADAVRRMQEINSAFEVLGDPAKRRAYDEARHAAHERSTLHAEGDEINAFEAEESASATDWAVAAEYFPEIDAVYRRLRHISRVLAFSFRVVMLESREFRSARDIASKMEQSFLTAYFGRDPEIHAFARDLIFSGDRDAALELNRVVSVLGDAAKANDVRERISRKFSLEDRTEKRRDRKRAESILAKVEANRLPLTQNDWSILLDAIGGRYKSEPTRNGLLSAFSRHDEIVELDGQTFKFPNRPLKYPATRPADQAR